jgi:hypothetical protein
MDETPFGGYKDWHYFCCLGFTRPGKVNETEIQKARLKQAGDNARLLKAWAAGRHLEVEFNTSVTG